jgi:hypothetical protein
MMHTVPSALDTSMVPESLVFTTPDRRASIPHPAVTLSTLRRVAAPSRVASCPQY